MCIGKGFVREVSGVWPVAMVASVNQLIVVVMVICFMCGLCECSFSRRFLPPCLGCRMSVQSTSSMLPDQPPLLSVTSSLPVGRSPSPLAHLPTQSLSSHEHATSWESSPHSFSSSEHLTPGTASSVGVSPQQLMAIQEEENTPSSVPGSPNLRGFAGKRVGGTDMTLSLLPPFSLSSLSLSLFSSPHLPF